MRVLAALPNYSKYCLEAKKYLEQKISLVTFEIPQATYLAWLDFSALHVPDDFTERLKFEGHVELQAGVGFGEAYKEYQRLNVACPRKTLEEGLNRIYKWLKENKYL